MKIGICLPYFKGGGYDRQRILRWARMVDEGPFSALSCGERINGQAYDMHSLLCAAAAATERVRLLPSLYVLPMRSTVWTAKQIATLDVLCEGRLEIVVGVGGREQDYRALGVSMKGRHQRMDEQVAEMRRLWNGEPPYAGAEETGPLPVQGSGLPVLLGAMGPKSMRRGAEWADGVYVFSMDGKKEEIDAMLGMADSAWQEAGHDRTPRKICGFWYSLAHDDAAGKLHDYVHDYMKIADESIAKALAGAMTRNTPDRVRAALDDMEATGCEECILVPASADYGEIERAAEIIATR